MTTVLAIAAAIIGALFWAGRRRTRYYYIGEQDVIDNDAEAYCADCQDAEDCCADDNSGNASDSHDD